MSIEIKQWDREKGWYMMPIYPLHAVVWDLIGTYVYIKNVEVENIRSRINYDKHLVVAVNEERDAIYCTGLNVNADFIKYSLKDYEVYVPYI